MIIYNKNNMHNTYKTRVKYTMNIKYTKSQNRWRFPLLTLLTPLKSLREREYIQDLY